MLNNFDALMEFYGDSTPWTSDAIKSLDPKLLQRMEELASMQMEIIQILQKKDMEDSDIRELILGPVDFVRLIEKSIWSRS